MKVYLVYGLDLDDSSNEPYVKKAFAREYDADKYAKERESLKDRAFVQEIELE